MMHRLYVACLQVGLMAHSGEYYCDDSCVRKPGTSRDDGNRVVSEGTRSLEWSLQARKEEMNASAAVARGNRRVDDCASKFTFCRLARFHCLGVRCGIGSTFDTPTHVVFVSAAEIASGDRCAASKTSAARVRMLLDDGLAT
jgi:hypothetical protein